MRTRIATYRGFIDLFDPQPKDVNMLDIAHSLSGMSRYNHHTMKAYSVAQHSVFVADRVPMEFRLVALLHDAAEAYTGDTIAPIKDTWGRTEHTHEERFLRVIGQKFGVNLIDLPECVRVADMRARATEKLQLFSPRSWPPEEFDARYPHYEARISPLGQELAMAEFIQRFHEFGGRTH